MAAAAVAVADAELERNAALNPLDAAEVRKCSSRTVYEHVTLRCMITGSSKHTWADSWILYCMSRAS
jgi:hypothetical protein